jgi:hypothetical protein
MVLFSFPPTPTECKTNAVWEIGRENVLISEALRHA